MADILTTLHPDDSPNDDLYPNVKRENIPSEFKNNYIDLTTVSSNDINTYIDSSYKIYANVFMTLINVPSQLLGKPYDVILEVIPSYRNNSLFSYTQILTTTKNGVWIRTYIVSTSTWGTWERIEYENKWLVGSPQYTELKLYPFGYYHINKTTFTNYTDVPSNLLGLEIECDLYYSHCYYSSSGYIDVMILITESNGIYIRTCPNGVWNNWIQLSNDGITFTEPTKFTIREYPTELCCFKTVGVIGDSLASGEVYSGDSSHPVAHDMYEFSWGKYLEKITGNNYYIFAKGGLSTRTWNSSEFATLCFDGEHPCDAYIIGLQVNDFSSVTLGTIDDIDVEDYTQNADTYYGNYAKIIQRIHELYPKAKVFCLYYPEGGTTYNTAIGNICELLDNAYPINLWSYAKQFITEGIISECKRNGHYNALAYRLIAKVIYSAIDYYIETHIEDFQQIEFINTNLEWD